MTKKFAWCSIIARMRSTIVQPPRRKSDHTIALMTLIEIALRYEKELGKNDTTPYDNILSQLTSEVEEALKSDK